MNGKNFLILYAAIGLGHKSIAENIGYYLTQEGFEVKLFDVQKIEEGKLTKGGQKLYQFLITRFPSLWNWLYNTGWFISLTLPLRNLVAGFNYKKVLAVVNDFQPDVIISTHTTASGVVNYLKKQKLYSGKFGIAFSDFHLHRYWLYPEADFYLANIQEQKNGMQALGVRADKIFVCGMILRPKLEVDALAVKAALGIAQSQKVILISSGSQGTEIDQVLIAKLSAEGDVTVIVVCGKNKKLFEALQSKFAKPKVLLFGYYAPMDELYAIADIYVTKPGGLSVSESLSWRLPIIISHLLPGQEQHNYHYLIGMGWVMPHQHDIVSQALGEIRDKEFKSKLSKDSSLASLFQAKEALIPALKSL